MVDKILHRKTHPTGTLIFHEGDRGDLAFIVQSGEVEIFKTSEDEEKILGTISNGGIFGEMALIDSSPRMASARFSVGGTLIVIDRKTFEHKMNSTDPFIKALLNIFVSNIRKMAED